MSVLHARAALAGAVLVGALFTQVPAGADIGAQAKTNARADRIVGLWDVQVAAGPCGGPLGPPFPAMHQYQLGGTGQVVPIGNPTGISAHMMVWEHVGGNDYRAAIKFYRYDAGGAPIGYNVITNDVTISQDGQEYAGSGIVDFYAMNGDFQFALCPVFAGTRFNG